MPSLKDKLGLAHPIIQAPMAGGIISPEFIAQVTQYGILGSLATGYLKLNQIEMAIKTIQSHSTKPFMLNFFVDYQPYSSQPMIKPDAIIAMEQAIGAPANHHFTIPPIPTMEDLIDLAINHDIKIISTCFNLLSDAHIKH